MHENYTLYIPGFRGSHILRMGSDPPAATRAEPSPPTCKQLRAFPQNCIIRTKYKYLNNKGSFINRYANMEPVSKHDEERERKAVKIMHTYYFCWIFAYLNIPTSNGMIPWCRVDCFTFRPNNRRYALCMAHKCRCSLTLSAIDAMNNNKYLGDKVKETYSMPHYLKLVNSFSTAWEAFRLMNIIMEIVAINELSIMNSSK